MRLQHIHTMIAVSEEGSIRGAAKRLGRTQPALTKNLRQMEDELGVALFHRTPRGVVTTEIGQMVLARARSVALEMQRLQNEVEQLRGGQFGAVKICVSPAGALLVMPRALASFRKRYPAVDISVVDGLYPASLQPLRDGQVDLLIGPTPPLHWSKDFRVEPLFMTDIIVITSHESEYANARSLRELQSGDWVMLGGREGPGDIIEKSFRDNGLIPPVSRTSAESYLTALAAVAEMGLLCTFPEKLYLKLKDQFKVHRIALEETIAPMEVSLLTRAGLPLTPAAEEMANCIRWWGSRLASTDAR
ncbi:LysR family transcriptional regulator [Marinobacterium aestuariivivens]|uniref:LysR family transcriptional regulator n=1 Tax=Marinobacterium aestuariivivens TaxID=1698799 RepID=A0ABW2AA25_9GAMM